MAALKLFRETYLDKVYGGWLGKNAGGTLGSPIEGKKDLFNLKFYDPRPGQSAWNEDLDFQLVALEALRKHGPDITSDQLASAVQEHIAYRWDEYGYASYNLHRGLRPPITGAFNNWFRQGDGAAIRTELWAMIAPGSPQTAAEYAYRDAIIDHAQEGVWSAMARAAMQSAAFFVSDVQVLLDIALAMMPATCRTAKSVRIARDAWRNRATWLDARAQVITAVGNPNFADAPQNMGFMTIGLLYGAGDFGASICAAANCGYDADGNAGAVGALFGIMRGKSSLPSDWMEPIGDSVVLGWGVINLDAERLTSELAAHTVEVGEKVVEAHCPDVELTDEDPLLALEAPLPAPPEPVHAASEPSTTGFAMPDLAESAPTPDSTEPAAGVPPTAIGRAAFIELDAPPAEQTKIPPESPGEQEPATPGGIVEELSAKPVDASVEETAAEPVTAAPVDTSTEPAATVDSAIQDTASAEAIEPSPEPAAPVVEIPVPEPLPVQAPVAPAVNWLDNARIKPLLVMPVNSAVYHSGQYELTVDYGDTGPALIPEQASSFTVAIRNLAETEFMGHVTLSAPTGWQVAVPGAQGQRQMLSPGGMARYGFVVRVPEGVPLAARNTVTLILTPEKGAPTTCDINFLSGTCWWFVGPFANRGEEGFHKVYPVEDRADFQDSYLGRAGGMIEWQKRAFRENVMELESLFGGTSGVAYGVTTIHVPAPTEARFVVHTNDGIHVWLNRQSVLKRHSHEPFRPTLGYGPAQVDVNLSAGDNQVMLKVVRCGEPIELAFSLVDRKGEPILNAITSRWT